MCTKKKINQTKRKPHLIIFYFYFRFCFCCCCCCCCSLLKCLLCRTNPSCDSSGVSQKERYMREPKMNKIHQNLLEYAKIAWNSIIGHSKWFFIHFYDSRLNTSMPLRMKISTCIRCKSFLKLPIVTYARYYIHTTPSHSNFPFFLFSGGRIYYARCSYGATVCTAIHKKGTLFILHRFVFSFLR